jgi:hypothetical protein
MRRLVMTMSATLLIAVAATSSAQAKNLTIEVGGVPVTTPAPYTATSSDFQIATGEWTMVCPNSALTGKILSNGLADDEAGIATGEFAGEPLCSSPHEFVTTFNPKFTMLTLVGTGKVKWSGPRFKLTPKESLGGPPGGHNACQFEAKNLKGTFPVGKTPQPLVVTFSKLKLNLVREAAGSFCERGGTHTLSATFTFTSEGQPLEVHN